MIARQLFQLQELDLDIESKQRTLDELTSRLGETEELKNTRAELTAAQARLDDLKKQQTSLEWEVDDLTAKIKAINDKLYGGKIRNPKELEGYQQEGQALKGKCSQVEDKALAVMTEIDTLLVTVKQKAGELQKVEAEWRTSQQELQGEIDRLKAALADLEARRQQVASQIKGETLEFYQNLRQQKGTAVARVEQGRCSGCRILLAITEIQRSRNSLVQCSSCGRILFVP